MLGFAAGVNMPISEPRLRCAGQDESSPVLDAMLLRYGHDLLAVERDDSTRAGESLRDVHPSHGRARKSVNRLRFDGIFLDLEMPRPDGFQLASLIRDSSWNKSTPIIIVTGRDDLHTMHQAFSFGATFFLQKLTGVIEVAGTVVWADERRQGIQFTKLSAKAQQDIRQLIADVQQTEG